MTTLMPLRPLEEMLALGLDDCGLPLDGHPELPRPRRWEEGRPCGRAVDRTGPARAKSSLWNGSVTPRSEITPFR